MGWGWGGPWLFSTRSLCTGRSWHLVLSRWPVHGCDSQGGLLLADFLFSAPFADCRGEEVNKKRGLLWLLFLICGLLAPKQKRQITRTWQTKTAHILAARKQREKRDAPSQAAVAWPTPATQPHCQQQISCYHLQGSVTFPKPPCEHSGTSREKPAPAPI